jgi:hypothetical protein
MVLEDYLRAPTMAEDAEIPEFDHKKTRAIYKALMAKAKGLHDDRDKKNYVTDAGKRVAATHELWGKYKSMAGAFQELFADSIDRKFDPKGIHKFLGKHHKAYQARIAAGDNGLSDTEVKEHMEELIEEILPQLGYRAEGEGEAVNAFNRYAKLVEDDPNAKKYLQRMRTGIATGDALMAAEGIKGVMKVYHTSKHMSDFRQTNFDGGDAEYDLAHAGHIAKEAGKKAGGLELSVAGITADFKNSLTSFLNGDYLSLASTHKDMKAANNNKFYETKKTGTNG